MALLMANMRVPEEREGDFNASLDACRVAERRIRRIYERYGTDTVHAAIRINLDRTERRLRERIAELPDGSYCYEDYLEYYEEGRLDPVLVRIELTVDGDGIVADFAGSNPGPGGGELVARGDRGGRVRGRQVHPGPGQGGERRRVPAQRARRAASLPAASSWMSRIGKAGVGSVPTRFATACPGFHSGARSM